MDAGRPGAARWLAVAWFWLCGNITAAPGVFRGVAGVSAAWLQFFWRDHAEHVGEGPPHFQRLPAMDGQHFRPAGLTGWNG